MLCRNLGLILQSAEGHIRGAQCAAINDLGQCFINHQLCKIQRKEGKQGEKKENSVVMKTSETERTHQYECLKIEIKHLQKSASGSSACLKPSSFPGLQVLSFLTVFICSGFSTVLSNT